MLKGLKIIFIGFIFVRYCSFHLSGDLNWNASTQCNTSCNKVEPPPQPQAPAQPGQPTASPMPAQPSQLVPQAPTQPAQ